MRHLKTLGLIAVATLFIIQTASAKHPYYPESFQRQVNKDTVLKDRGQSIENALFQVLDKRHQKRRNQPDLLGCRHNRPGKCYDQKKLGYRGARKKLFGELYLKKDRKGDYYVKDVYCQKNLLGEWVRVAFPITATSIQNTRGPKVNSPAASLHQCKSRIFTTSFPQTPDPTLDAEASHLPKSTEGQRVMTARLQDLVQISAQDTGNTLSRPMNTKETWPAPFSTLPFVTKWILIDTKKPTFANGTAKILSTRPRENETMPFICGKTTATLLSTIRS